MVRLKLPILTLIFNNSILGWIKHIQKDRYSERYISTDFTKVDFATVAKGFGAEGYSINSLDQLSDLLKTYQTLQKPVVIDILTDQWETPVLNFNQELKT